MRLKDRRALAAAIRASLAGDPAAHSVIRLHGGPALAALICAVNLDPESHPNGALGQTVTAAHSAAWDCAVQLADSLESGDLSKVLGLTIAIERLAPTEDNIRWWKMVQALPKPEPMVSALVDEMARKVALGASPAEAIRGSLPKGVSPGGEIDVMNYPSNPDGLEGLGEDLEASVRAFRNERDGIPFTNKAGKPKKVKIPTQGRLETLVRERRPSSEKKRKQGRPPKR